MKNLSWVLLLLALAPVSFKAYVLSAQPLSASITAMNDADEEEEEEDNEDDK